MDEFDISISTASAAHWAYRVISDFSTYCQSIDFVFTVNYPTCFTRKYPNNVLDGILHINWDKRDACVCVSWPMACRFHLRLREHLGWFGSWLLEGITAINDSIMSWIERGATLQYVIATGAAGDEWRHTRRCENHTRIYERRETNIF